MLHLSPNLESATSLRNLGWYQYLAGRINESINTNRSWLEKDSSLTDVSLNLGLCFATPSGWPKAKQEYDVALKTASKREIQEGVTDLQDAIKNHAIPPLEQALDYLNNSLSKAK